MVIQWNVIMRLSNVIDCINRHVFGDKAETNAHFDQFPARAASSMKSFASLYLASQTLSLGSRSFCIQTEQT